MMRGAALACVVVLAGCGSGDPDIAGEWVPTYVSEEYGEQLMQLDFDKAHIEFDADGSWSARDGCNNVSGEYEVDQGDFESSTSGASAGVGCPRGSLHYRSVLGDAATVRLEDGRLVFVDDDGEAILELEPVE